MHWTVVAPFIREQSDSQWLTPFVPGQRHQFRCIPRQGSTINWHDAALPVTGRDEWLRLWNQSQEAVKAKQGGIITVFPQLAATVGLQQRFSLKRFPVIAWWFNVGTCYSGLKAWLACNSLKDINRFIVHTSSEREIYSQWLGLPLERFEFVPLQVPEIPVTYKEETTHPFILATGSACRDYPLLFEAVKKLNIRAVVVSGPRALAGLSVPPQVETPFGLERQEILRLGQEARINVVPMTEEGPTAGTRAIVEAMRMGRAVIATRRSGIEDYIKDGKTGILVEPNSLDDLVQAINKLWNDQELRDRIGQAAARYTAENCSDEAAGAAMGRILDQVANETHLN
ncbi:MAG: glycosyltransferase family 4 protein [Microcoleus sp. SIO2G3]|nr:glycosyltransferase family 4 protein [Microcoleus sp. SIO2G3]